MTTQRLVVVDVLCKQDTVSPAAPVLEHMELKNISGPTKSGLSASLDLNQTDLAQLEISIISEYRYTFDSELGVSY